MGTGRESSVAIGIVADPSNFAAEQFFEKQLSLSIRNAPDFRHYRVLSDPLTHNVSSCGHTQEITTKFDKGYQVVVAIMGVPDASSYRQDIHGLLDTWKYATDKPSLLLVSSHPDMTRAAIESWSEWDRLPDELKAAIKVNDEYLVINAQKTLDSLRERVEAYTSLRHALQSSHVIEPHVTEPVFMRSRNLRITGMAKG